MFLMQSYRDSSILLFHFLPLYFHKDINLFGYYKETRVILPMKQIKTHSISTDFYSINDAESERIGSRPL